MSPILSRLIGRVPTRGAGDQVSSQDIANLDRAIRELGDSVRGELGEIHRVLVELSTFVHERLLPPEEMDQLVKTGWRRARPTVELTWNAAMTGDEFLGHLTAASGTRFARIVEIGPGYGRVLRTLLASGVAFEAYHGLDISPENVRHLTTTFEDARLRFTNVDFLTHAEDAPVDLVYSSAVFLHLYPSVVPALRWSLGALRPGGYVCFDVPHGARRYVDASWGLYVREYAETELRDLVSEAGFTSCDIVPETNFAPGVPGWFVAARK